MTANTETAVSTEVKIVRAVEASLWQREEAIRAILPNGMDMRRFVKTAMIALSKNKDLHDCTQESIVRSIIEAAEAGLEPTGMLGRAWLVPYKNKGVKEAQLQIGYQGLIDLARRSGEVRKIISRVVYEGDAFRVVQGTEERVEHEPAYLTEDPLKIQKVYCIVTYRDGTSQHEVMTKSQVDAVRAKAMAKNADAWTLNYPEMARKTVVRRATKYVPLTPEAIEAIAKDDEREFGAPTVGAVIGQRTSSLKESIKAQAQEIEGEAVEVPIVESQSAPEPTEARPTEDAVPQDVEQSEAALLIARVVATDAALAAAEHPTAVDAGKAAQRQFQEDFNRKAAVAQASALPTAEEAASWAALKEPRRNR